MKRFPRRMFVLAGGALAAVAAGGVVLSGQDASATKSKEWKTEDAMSAARGDCHGRDDPPLARRGRSRARGAADRHERMDMLPRLSHDAR